MSFEESEAGVVGSLLSKLPITLILSTALLSFLVVFTWRRMSTPAIPIVNSYPTDFTLRKAHAKFLSNARGLIIEGTQKVLSDNFANTNTADLLPTVQRAISHSHHPRISSNPSCVLHGVVKEFFEFRPPGACLSCMSSF